MQDFTHITYLGGVPLAQEAVAVRMLTPDEFTAFVAVEIARWQPVMKALGPLAN